MALIGNYSVLNKTCGRFTSGSTVSDNRSNFNTSGNNRNFYAGWMSVANVTNRAAIPQGYRPPYSRTIAIKNGGLAGALSGTGTVSSANAAMGVNLVGSLTGSGDISSGIVQLVVSAAANLTGSGSITTATIVGALNATASLTGSGTITAAGLSAPAYAIAALTGSGTVVAGLNATGALSATITIGAINTVLEEIIEGDVTLQKAIRLLLAVNCGKTDITGSTVTFRDTTDSTNRVVATVVSSERTAVTLDPS